MITFEDFLSEGKKIQIKRKYTENYPAKTVGKTANVRNSVIQAIKDGVVTREEFNKILSELSTSSSQWASRNRKYFNVSEEGIKLSKWGRRILAELDETPKAAEVFEATVVMDAIDPKSKTLKKLLKKYKVKMKVLTMNGPGGNWPEVELTGTREDLQAILADPNGWDDPELGEYIEEASAEKLEEKIKITKDEWPYIEFKDGGKKHKVEFDYEDIIDDHGNEGQDQYWIGKDEDGQEWTIDVYADYRGEVQDVLYDTLVKESVVNEAKFVKEFDKAVLDAETKKDVLKVYPKAEFYVGKMSHFFGELEPNLFFKAYYAKYYKQDTGKSIKGDFKITTVYSEKGSKYVNLHLEESTVTEAKGFKNTKDFEDFLEEIDGMGEAQIKKIMGKDYIDTPGFYQDEKDDYADVTDFMMSNMGRKEFQKLQDWWETNVAESVVNEAKNDGNLDTIADYVKQVLDDGKSFMDIGKKLKGAYKYDFSTGMMPMYIIPVSGNKIVIINKKYVENGQADRIVGDIAIGLMENIKTEITNMENTFSIHESFASFTGANGFLNEKLGSQILASILMGNKEGKYGKKNLAALAGGFYQMTKVALDKIQDEDFILDNDPQKAFKNHGGSKNIIFFISDNEKENPYLPSNSGSYGSLATIPGGGILLAAMGGDREFYTNDWSRYSKNRSWKKDGRKGSEDQIGVNKKYRGWDASGLNNGKRIAEVSDRVIIVNLDLIRQKYSTQQLRDARASAKAGAIAFKSDKEFKAENKNRYHQILATKAASMPIDKMVEGAIDALATQIKDGLASGDKTRYDEIKIGETSKGREAKLRDASNHMSNILDNYSRYCNYIKQSEESVDRYGQAESYYEREAKNYAKEIKDQIAKIKGFDYAW